ncbi:MAG: hypothetical protein R2824_31930 [Saprospiraceae bacterium]
MTAVMMEVKASPIRRGLKLQAEGHDVLYRNIWIKELDLTKADTDF